MLDTYFLPLVPGCVMVQRNGSVCVSLNINSENYSFHLEGNRVLLMDGKLPGKLLIKM